MYARAVRGFSDCNGFFRGLPRGRLKGGVDTVIGEDVRPNALSSGSRMDNLLVLAVIDMIGVALVSQSPQEAANQRRGLATVIGSGLD